MRAIEILKTFFEREQDLAAVYLYGRYGSGPSFADTDIEIGLLFPATADEDDVRDYMEHLSNVNPLGSEPGILMPFALNTHVLPVIFEVMTGGTVLVDHQPSAREAFFVQMQTRLDKERAQILEDAKESIAQARALGLGLAAASGLMLPQPPKFLDPIRIGWRLNRVMASVAVLEATTRDPEAAGRDPERLGQTIGWFSNAVGAATGMAKSMLNIFEMERPSRRWQVFLPLADSGLVSMDLALFLGALVELRWQLLTSSGMLSADRVLGSIRGSLPHLIVFARLAAWYCETPGGRGDSKVH